MNEELKSYQVVSQYVRAADFRDGKAMAALFVKEGVVEIFTGTPKNSKKGAELVSAEAIGAAVSQMMSPHPERGWSHHTTMNPIIKVNGDKATVDSQFIVYEVRGAEKPKDGWPEGAFGCQGTVHPIESGYYYHELVKIDGEWKISKLKISLDLPMAGID